MLAPALVLSQRDDPLHSLDVAQDLAAALPAADELVLPPGGLFWTAARQAQDALARHLDPSPQHLPATPAPEPPETP